MQGVACQLNESCYSLPQDNDAPSSQNSSSTNQLNQLTQLAFDAFEFFNRPEVISSALTLASGFREFIAIRNKAGQITQNLTLSQYLLISADSLKIQLNSITNDTILVNGLLNSNPNYNYLYSNYSKNVTNLNAQLESVIPPELIDLAYGPDLDVII